MQLVASDWWWLIASFGFYLSKIDQSTLLLIATKKIFTVTQRELHPLTRVQRAVESPSEKKESYLDPWSFLVADSDSTSKHVMLHPNLVGILPALCMHHLLISSMLPEANKHVICCPVAPISSLFWMPTIFRFSICWEAYQQLRADNHVIPRIQTNQIRLASASKHEKNYFPRSQPSP